MYRYTFRPPWPRRLVFGDPEQIAAIRALPPVVDPGTWLGRTVRFRPWYPRYEYVDPDDPTNIEICAEIEAGRATVIEDRSADPNDGRVLVKTAAGEMWCDPADLQAVPNVPAKAVNGDLRGVAPFESPTRTVYRVTVEFRGHKEYEIAASSPEVAKARAWELARDDEPDEWEPIDDVEVEET